VSSSHRDELQNLVALSWVALRQASDSDEPVDAKTMQFFSSVSTSGPILRPQKRVEAPVVEQPKKRVEAPVVEQPKKRMEAPVVEQPKKRMEAPVVEQSQDEPSPPTTEEPPLPPSQTRRLEKLLPRSSTCASSDTADVRRQILSKSASSCLSETQLYKDPPAKNGPKRWTIFTHLTPAQPPTPRDAFMTSVVKAIGERLQVNVRVHSCTDPLFALELPMALDDSEVVILVVEAHLESALQGLLEPIHSYSQSSQLFEPPFSVIGAINGKPLRTLVLHPSIHEDPTLKSQLWQSLKALATLTSPY
jgi:hypothetical protein